MSPRRAACIRYAGLAGVLVAGAGAVVMVGWLLSADALKTLFAGGTTIKANTALSLMLSGAGLALLRRGERRRPRVLALAVLAFALGTLAEYAFGIRLGIDELLFEDPDTATDMYPGRAAPNTSLALMLSAAGLVFSHVRLGRVWLGSALPLSGAVVGLVAVLGYALDTPSLYGIGEVAGMALPTALAMIALGVGIAAARPEHGLVELVTRDSAGGSAARGLLPAVSVVPPVLGILSWYGHDLGLYDAQIGILLLVTSVALAMAAMVAWFAKSLDRLERARAESEASLVDAAPDAMVLVDEGGRVTRVNGQAERLFGYGRSQLHGMEIDALVPREQGGAIRARRKDGSEVPVEVSLSPVTVRGGEMTLAVVRDVTERMHAEARLKEFERFFDISRDLPCTVAFDGHFQHLNDSWTETLGWSAEELRARPSIEFVHPDDRESTLAHVAKLAEGATTVEFQNRYLAKDGRWRWLEWASVGIPEDRLIYGAARDVTERVRADAELTLRGEVMANMAEGVVLVRARDARIVHCNPEFERMFGYAAGELLGRTAEILNATADGEPGEVVGAAFGPLTEDGAWTGEVQTVKKDGSEFCCLVHVSRFDHSEHGEVAVAVHTDITDHKLMAQELERSNEELEQFAYLASHDLIEPLRVIAGFVQLLQRRYEGRLDEQADRFIEATVDGVERMHATIDALLEYARVGRAGLGMELVDCDRSVREARLSLNRLLSERAVELHVGHLPTVRGEPALLAQLFQNLISNAAKYGNSEHPEVDLHAERVNGHWQFSVEDNGPGVAPEQADHVFDMFKRLHGRDHAGTGMGLTICKRIVEKHGGRIWVEPRKAGGSAFRFTVPVGSTEP